jgi:hypothetical protein
LAAEFFASPNPQTVQVGGNVQFTDSIPCPCGYVIHREGSGLFTLRGVTFGCQRQARYKVTFNGNIAIPEGGTVAAIALDLAIGGEPLQYSRAIVTPAAVEQFANVTCTAVVSVTRGCCYTVAVRNVPAGVGGTIEQQAVVVADGNLTIEKTA